MKIRIIEACYIDGKRADIGTEHILADETKARVLVNLGRPIPVVSKVTASEPSVDPRPKGKR